MEGIVEGNVVSLLTLGFVLGLRHSLDLDHLIAVSTVVSERKGLLSSSIVGMLWGLGHTFSLLIVGLLVIALELRIPAQVALTAEFAVAAMLVILGVRVTWKLIHGERIHLHVHSHGNRTHTHFHFHNSEQLHDENHTHHLVRGRLGSRRLLSTLGHGRHSLLIGMVHGFAGSAALMLVVLATIPSVILGLEYIAAFGLGSIAGMSGMSILVGIPFAFTSGKAGRLNIVIRGASGIISIAFGMFLAWQIAFVEGLLMF